MLQSELFKGDAELARVAGGTGAIRPPQRSEAVARVQQALLAVGFGLPRGGVDEIFGDETGRAAVAFKEARGLANLDPVLGGEAVRRLDLELAYLEGNPTPRRCGTPVCWRWTRSGPGCTSWPTRSRSAPTRSPPSPT